MRARLSSNAKTDLERLRNIAYEAVVKTRDQNAQLLSENKQLKKNFKVSLEKLKDDGN